MVRFCFVPCKEMSLQHISHDVVVQIELVLQMIRPENIVGIGGTIFAQQDNKNSSS